MHLRDSRRLHSTFIQTHCRDNIVLVKSIIFSEAPAGIPRLKLFRQANGLAYWNPGSELNVSPVDCPAQPEVKRTSHPKQAGCPLQGQTATIEDAEARRRDSRLKSLLRLQQALSGIRRRPTLPDRYQSSTIGTEGLNFCVRYGNRWDPFVIATGNGELF